MVNIFSIFFMIYHWQYSVSFSLCFFYLQCLVKCVCRMIFSLTIVLCSQTFVKIGNFFHKYFVDLTIAGQIFLALFHNNVSICIKIYIWDLFRNIIFFSQSSETIWESKLRCSNPEDWRRSYWEQNRVHEGKNFR